MSVAMARGCLFLALLVMLPLPFYFSAWLMLTPAYVFLLVVERLSAGSITLFNTPIQAETLLHNVTSWALLLQLLLAWLFSAGLAYLYGLCSSHWPSKIRGSIMGIVVMAGLILLSTWPVYDGFPVVKKGLSFLELYHQ